jgi:hypothetical protein
MSERRSELSKYQAAIVALAQRVLDVDIRAYESLPHDRLASELQPVVSQLLASAHALVADIFRTYEAESEPVFHDEPGSGALAAPYVGFEQAIDAAIDNQGAASVSIVGDIAFLAHLELRQRAERLERVTACRNAIAIIGECDSALRRIRKALTSIDVALARAGLVQPSLDFTSELEVSLRVRRACAKLRARAASGGEPTAETLHARLRKAGTAIAMLVGWEVYPSLRVRDRLHLRDLQRRILDWLRRDRDVVDGMRLWQDLSGFISMLSQVNRRQELVEHDTRVVSAARARIAACGPELDEATLALLASLEGLDDEVDALLASSERGVAARWHAPLERLAAQLRCGQGGS